MTVGAVAPVVRDLRPPRRFDHYVTSGSTRTVGTEELDQEHHAAMATGASVGLVGAVTAGGDLYVRARKVRRQREVVGASGAEPGG